MDFVLDETETLSTDVAYEQPPLPTFEGCKLSLNKLLKDRVAKFV